MPVPPDPLSPPAAAGTQPLLSVQDFAAKIRTAYPGVYDHLADDDLTHRIVTKYPVYRSAVVDVLGGAPEGFGPPALPGGPPAAPPDPNRFLHEEGIMDDARKLGRGLVGAAKDWIAPQPNSTTLQDLTEGVTGSIVRGGVRAYEGAKAAGALLNRLPNDQGVIASAAPPPTLSGEEAARPFADVIGGVMEASELGLIPAAMAAPWATALALGTGTVAQTATEKGATALGAPPAVAEILGDVGGLAAGGVTAHRVGARGAARDAALTADRTAAIQKAEGIRSEMAELGRADAEGIMRGELADETGRVVREQAAEGVLADWQRQKEDAFASLAVNQGLLELARAHEASIGGARVGGPFAYLDQAEAARRGSLAALEAAQAGRAQQTIDPNRLLPQSTGPRAYSAEPPPADYLGVQDRSVPPPPPPDTTPGLVGDVVGAFERSLGTQPVEDPLIRDARIRAEVTTQVAHDIASNLEDNPYIPGGLVDSGVEEGGIQGRVYAKATPPSPLFREIVGEATQNPPPVELITDIARVFADTGATSAKDIPQARLLQLRQAKGYGPREFTNAYDRWMPELLRVRDARVSSEVFKRNTIEAYQAQQRALEGERGRLVPGSRPVPEDGAPPTVEGLGLLDAEEAPPSPPALVEGEMPPDWLDDVLTQPEGPHGLIEGESTGTTHPVEVPESVRGGQEQPSLPGTEGVRDLDTPTPEFEAPFSLTSEPAPTAPGTATQPSFWDALKSDAGRLLTDEEGALRFTVDPHDAPAVRRWLDRQLAEHGHESWYDAARQALEEGDLPSAVRIISIASARSHMAELATARQDKDTPGAMPALEIADAIERTRESHRKQVETELGIPLPKSVDVSPEGILTFQPGGKGVPALRARATDLTLARSLAGDLTGKADPTQIIRAGLSDDVPKQLQISSQIADQIAREFDPAVIADLAELMGFDKLPEAEQRLEIARQYTRGYSHAGRMLGELGRWAQANEDAFYQYAPVNETGKIGELGSVGALQASGITTPDGFVQWLGKAATPDQLAEMQFRMPRGMELKDAKGNLTPEAKVYARNWFRRGQRLHEVQTTIDRLVGDQGNALDRAVAATTIAPQTTTDGQGRLGALNSLTKAALISRPGTMIRNTISQTGRYAAGMADEALASFFSLATGNPDQATKHARNLRYLTQGLTRKGVSSLNLFKHPWADGLQAIYDYTSASIATLPATDARKTLSLLSDVPHEEARFLGSLSLEGIRPDAPGARSRFPVLKQLQTGLDLATRPEVRNTLTLFNRVQEHFFRASVFDAMLRAQIEAKGIDPVEALAGDPRGLIDRVGANEFDRMAGAAVSTALDYTFAADPLPGTAPAMLLNVFQKTPVLSFLLQLGMPFPRFNFVSAPRWVWDHTPVAPVSDLFLLGFNTLFRNDASPAFRGRFHQMLQAKRSEGLLLDLDMQIGRGKYDAAKYLSDFMSAKESQRQAGNVLKGLEKREGQGSSLPELSDDLSRIRAEQEAAQERAVGARAKWRETDLRVKNLEGQKERARRTVRDLGAVGAAKSPQEYFARAATGTAMLGAGWALWQWKADHSTTPGSPDSQWYELPMDWLPADAQRLAGVENQAVDLRSFAPEVQHLFLPDVLADVQAHTDWTELRHQPWKVSDLHFMSDYMRRHYTGKYTSQKFTKDALEAYLTISPAAGSTRELMDILTGRSEDGNSGIDPGAIQDVLLSMAGQFVGRLSSPLGAVNDIVGQFSPEDAVARIPQEGTPENHSAFHELADPTIANIPGLRRVIPEKIDALTGQPVGSVDPLARQLGGITKRVRNRVQQELQATGLSYSQAVPRQTGDRQFDNEVNRQYAQILNEYFPAILEDETYQTLTPELKRDVLANGIPGRSGVFPMMKKLAISRAIEALGTDPALLKSPDSRDRLERWQQYAEQLDQELAPATDTSERELQAETPNSFGPAVDQDSGAPPLP